MATVKRGNVPPTHPTVWIGLALASVGLLLAIYAYTGARVYDIRFAFIALAGAFLALLGILTAAWGRSIMSSRASRARRAAFSSDAMSMSRPTEEAPTSDDAPTVAAPATRKRFAFSLGKRDKKEEARSAREPIPAGVFAFRRRDPAPAPSPAEPAPEPAREPEGAVPDIHAEEPLVTLAPADPVRVTLRCPQCSATFSAEGVRPFAASCTSCGFSATV